MQIRTAVTSKPSGPFEITGLTTRDPHPGFSTLLRLSLERFR